MKMENFEKAREIVKKIKVRKNALEIIEDEKKYNLKIGLYDKHYSSVRLSIHEELFEDNYTEFMLRITRASMKLYLQSRIDILEKEFKEIE